MTRLFHGHVKSKLILTRKLIHYVEETVAWVRRALQSRRPTQCWQGGSAEKLSLIVSDNRAIIRRSSSAPGQPWQHGRQLPL
jgi:hypothetical protein